MQNSEYLKVLELDKILNLLQAEASLEDSKQEALEIIPETELEGVKMNLKKTEDAYIFMSKYTAPVFSGAKNMAPALRRAEASAVLSIGELLDIADTLRGIRRVKEWRENCSGMVDTSLEDLFSFGRQNASCNI